MEIKPHVHLIEATKGSYVYLILGDEPVLVDTGMKGRGPAILAALASLGLKPQDLAHIVLTHSDVDHIGNAKMLAGATSATLWAPETEVPYIHGLTRGPGLRRVIPALMHVDSPHVDRTYRAGERIGGLAIIPAPGHTIGHVCALAGDVLLAGDLVTSRGGRLRPSPGLLTWDKEAQKRSLRDVGRLTFDWVCPAHGDPVRRGALWEALL